MASQAYGNISREEKEAFLKKKMEDMKKKSEEILRRHAEVEADKRNADMLSNMVSTKIQANPQTQSKRVAKSANSPSCVQKEKLSEKMKKGKNKIIHQISEENIHPAEWQQNNKLAGNSFTVCHKESEHRKNLSEDDGPPPDPVNYLADPYRDGSVPEVDRSQDSRRHKSNYGGESFHNVKPVMQQRRNYERQHPPPPTSSNHLSMSVQMTGKERKEYENWKAERIKIDEERIARQKTSSGTWKREWDLDKTEQEETAKKGDKQFYKQPRWISESGDHQDHTKKNHGNKCHFNPSFEYRHREKGDRSVVIDEHSSLTVIKSSGEKTFDSQRERKVFESKQHFSLVDEKISNTKSFSWKQNEGTVSGVSKNDGWEDVDVEMGGAKWDNDSSAKTDMQPLQQPNNADREWKAGIRYTQKRNDSVREIKAFVDSTRKSSSKIDFLDRQIMKRQNSSDKTQHFSDGWQAGQCSNNVRKPDDNWKDDTSWNRLRNDESKISDGWENIDEVKSSQLTKNSDGLEKEENWNNARENVHRRRSNEDDSLDSSSYEHKKKYFLGERSRGSSFKGNNNRVFSSSEKGKQYLENKKHENNYQRAFESFENKKFRENKFDSRSNSQHLDYNINTGRSTFWRGSKRGIDQERTPRGHGNAHRANLGSRDGFDYKGGLGRNEFWRDSEKEIYQGKTPRGRNNRGIEKAFKASKNSGENSYSKDDSFVNLGKDDSSSTQPVKDLNSKTQIGKDGWECEPNNELQPSVKWAELDEKESQESKKLPSITKYVENTCSRDSFDSGEGIKTSTPVDADTESHEDSWEDMTSGSESELSDVGDVQAHESKAPLLTEMNVCNDELENDSKTITSDMCIDNHMESTDYCKEIDMGFAAVSKDPHDDSIEKILEEVYNDTIKNENSRYAVTTKEQNVTEVSDCHEVISTQGINRFENVRCEDLAASSPSNDTISDLIFEAVSEHSSDVCYGDMPCEKSHVEEMEPNICKASPLDYSFNKGIDETSFVEDGSTYETIVASSLGIDKCDNVKNSDLPVISSVCQDSEEIDRYDNFGSEAEISLSVDAGTAKNSDLPVISSVCQDSEEIDRYDNFGSEAEISLSVDAGTATSEMSEGCVVSAEHLHTNSSHRQLIEQEIKKTVEFSSDQSKLHHSFDMHQKSQSVICEMDLNCKASETAQDCCVDTFSENIPLTTTPKQITEDTALSATGSISEGSLPEFIAKMSADVIKDSQQTKSDLQNFTSVNEDIKLLESAKNSSLVSLSSSLGKSKNMTTKEQNTSISCLSSELIEAKDKKCKAENGSAQLSSTVSNAKSNTEPLTKQTGESSQIEKEECNVINTTDEQECSGISISCLSSELIETKEKKKFGTEIGMMEVSCAVPNMGSNTDEATEQEASENVTHKHSENPSENKSMVLKSIEKLQDALQQTCIADNDPYVSTMQQLETIDDEKSKANACHDDEKVNSDSAKQTLFSISVQMNEVSGVSLPQVLPNLSGANNEETSSCSFSHSVDNCNTVSEPTNRLKETEYENLKFCVQPLSHSDSVVPPDNLSVADGNSLNLKDNTLSITGKLNVISETKEQISENGISECGRSSKSVTSDTKSLSDHLLQTVRKVSTTESTAEFTEVLEVITSVPQRILVQDSDATQIMFKEENAINKNECEYISDCSS